ncbi:Hpt domain-containing protein [Panacibacter sp. DH6]|uniref:Hpt domain-containing protein n=1 Tax=Panacibacter microcysteis TaxID=2793269 RepID=A0A931GSW5_9BACT|nr:Hpt domain-containing protein [Panacibacter microcysteis]MBG9374876.1 Hpt domain-containing protein [Panacibacter microcysteis]
MSEKPLYSLHKLKEIDDSEDFISQVIQIFLETVPANTEAMKKACDAQDWDQVYFYAHKIKANVNLLDITSIIDDVKEVEINARGRMALESIKDKVFGISVVIQKVADVLKDSFT